MSDTILTNMRKRLKILVNAYLKIYTCNCINSTRLKWELSDVKGVH